MAIRYNNPGNIRLIRNPDGSFPKPFIGEIRPNSDPFRKFGNPETGLRAMYKIILSDINRGFDTPIKLISSYAPKGDGANDPVRYADTVSKLALMKPTDKIGSSRIVPVVSAMAKVETGHFLPIGMASLVASKLNDDTWFKNLPGSAGTSGSDGSSGVGISFWADKKKRREFLFVGGIVIIGGLIYFKYVIKKKK